jgi:alpha-aminoadipic semialdehyde synthase
MDEPIVFCLTGKGGNVHSGAMKVLEQLPLKSVTIDELPHLHKTRGPHKSLYVLSLATADIVAPNEDIPFNRQHYQDSPDEYHSTFYSNIAPFINVLVNGIYWDERFPRLLTKEQIHQLAQQGNNRYVLRGYSCGLAWHILFPNTCALVFST